MSVSSATAVEEKPPLFEIIKRRGTEELINFLQTENLSLDDEDVGVLRRGRIMGPCFWPKSVFFKNENCDDVIALSNTSHTNTDSSIKRIVTIYL